MKIIVGKKTQIPIERLFLFIANFALIYLFVFRFIPTSLDDENYLYHFSMQKTIRDSHFSTAEYFYGLITQFLSTEDGFFGARALIFIGLILQFFCILQLKGIRSWLYMLGFYLLPNLAILYSYLQLRYGLGLGFLCLALCIDHKKRMWSQLTLIVAASLFHAGFLIFIPIYIICKYFYVKKNIITKYFFIELMILSIVTVIVGFIYVSAQLDTRFSQYSEAGLNIYGLGMIVLPMLALVFTQYFFEKKLSFETTITAFSALVLVGMHFLQVIPAALPRLFNTLLIMIIISALKSLHPSKYGIIFCIFLYFYWILVLSLSSEGLSSFDNWKYLL